MLTEFQETDFETINKIMDLMNQGTREDIWSECSTDEVRRGPPD
jgi:hypothetical protein